MRVLKGWPLVYIYSAFIFLVSVVPVKSVGFHHLYWDKLVHFFLYFFLVIVIIRALILSNLSTFLKKRNYLFAFGYAFFLGVCIELIQYFLPYRSFEYVDILFNILGSIVGICSYKIILSIPGNG